MTKILFVLAMTVSSSAFASVNCDRTLVRNEIITQLQKQFDDTVFADTVMVTGLLPEEVVPAGTSPVAAYFETFGFGGEQYDKKWIAQFSFDYSNCMPTFKSGSALFRK